MKTNKLLKTLVIFTLFNSIFTSLCSAQTTEPKVYMHYMAWFDSGPNGNHWSHGTAQEPLIGHYNSQSWATHLYHILLSSACGIDGMIINVRTEYDETSFKAMFPSLKRITDIHAEFDYSIGVSYDDQDRTQQTAEIELQVLRDEVLPFTTNYLYKNGQPVIFIWNYQGYLSSTDYRNAVSNVFTSQTPLLLRNEIDFGIGSGIIDSYYPWVQGYTSDGLEWGDEYLNWYYQALKTREEINFGTGAVWPGFDDRQASWGQNRWIDRRAGATYNDTWNLANINSSDLDWIIIETWNDWNEGSEIEPNINDGFKYVEQTATNIAQFKGTPNLSDTALFYASTRIYEAASLIESQTRDSLTYYPVLEQAISAFIARNDSLAFIKAQQVIDDLGSCTPPAITPHGQINGGIWQNGLSDITVNLGEAIGFAPASAHDGNWSWTGPNGFSSDERVILLSNLTLSQSGRYVANFVDLNGCINTQNFDLTVNDLSDLFYIVDRWQGSYLYDAGDQVGYANISESSLFQWKLKNIDGHTMIQNAYTGDFINIQNMWNTIECTPVPESYWSAHWTLEDYQSFTRIRNRWQGTDYMNIENLLGFVERSAIFNGAYSSHWTFLPVASSTSRVLPNQKNLTHGAITQVLYPNPMKNELSIRVNTRESIKIKITDHTGRMIYQNSLFSDEINNDSNFKIDVSSFDTGIYVISIEQGSEFYHHQMIKE